MMRLALVSILLFCSQAYSQVSNDSIVLCKINTTSGKNSDGEFASKTYLSICTNDTTLIAYQFPQSKQSNMIFYGLASVGSRELDARLYCAKPLNSLLDFEKTTKLNSIINSSDKILTKEDVHSMGLVGTPLRTELILPGAFSTYFNQFIGLNRDKLAKLFEVSRKTGYSELASPEVQITFESKDQGLTRITFKSDTDGTKISTEYVFDQPWKLKDKVYSGKVINVEKGSNGDNSFSIDFTAENLDVKLIPNVLKQYKSIINKGTIIPSTSSVPFKWDGAKVIKDNDPPATSVVGNTFKTEGPSNIWTYLLYLIAAAVAIVLIWLLFRYRNRTANQLLIVLFLAYPATVNASESTSRIYGLDCLHDADQFPNPRETIPFGQLVDSKSITSRHGSSLVDLDVTAQEMGLVVQAHNHYSVEQMRLASHPVLLQLHTSGLDVRNHLLQVATHFRGLNISCGCFGNAENDPIGWQSISIAASCFCAAMIGFLFTQNTTYARSVTS